MFRLKSVVLICILSIFLGFNFNQIYVKEDFDQPFNFRLLYSGLNIVGKIAQLFDNLGISPEYLVYRNLVDLINPVFALQTNHLLNIINTRINNIKVRIYEPKSILHNHNSTQPIFVYFHGGAFFLGSFDSFDLLLSTIAEKTGLRVFSVDYRLSPEHPFPIPTDDCWLVVDYLLKNPSEFNFDPSKLIIGGDSAGGNIALVISQRLGLEKRQKPLLQVLIYPWSQLPFINLPSCHNYRGGILSTITFSKPPLWYLGIKTQTEEMEAAIISNNHTLLLSEEEKTKFRSYLNLSLISEEYKNKPYYYHMDLIKSGVELEESSILVRDKNFANTVKLLFKKEVSPLLADLDVLKLHPDTYEIVCEWDGLKDQGLLLAYRLRQAGVKVDMEFYENCFHAMVPIIQPVVGFKYSNKILENMINHIKTKI